MILRFGLFLLPGLVLLSVPPGPAAGEGKPGLRAGAYAMDITPAKLPISVNGSMTDRQATAVHDRLHARCLILDDGKIELAIAVCDSCMMPREVLDDAKAQAARLTGIPPGRMLIAATHTHTAPTVAGVFQSDPDKDYQKFLAERIARGIEQAHKNRVPAQAGWGVAKEPTQVYNRRWHMKPGSLQADPFGRTTDKVKMNPGYQNPGLDRPAGPTDPDVAILSLRDRSEKPIALLANYSLHYVGGFPALSADYFGAFAERIGDTLGVAKTSPAFVGIMSNGTSGDVNNVNFAGMPPGKRQSGEQIRVVATSVAKVAAAACEKIDHTASVTLAMAEKEIELGVRRPGKEDLARAEELLASAKTPLRTLAGDLRSGDGPPGEISAGGEGQNPGRAHRTVGNCGDSLRSLRRDRPRHQEKKPPQADVHDRAGQWLQWLSADSSTAPAGRLRNLARPLQLPGSGRLDENLEGGVRITGGSKEIVFRVQQFTHCFRFIVSRSPGSPTRGPHGSAKR